MRAILNGTLLNRKKNITDLSFEVPHQNDCLGKDKEQVDEEDGVEMKD